MVNQSQEASEFAKRRKQRKQELRSEFFEKKSPVLKMGWRVLVSAGILGLGVWVVSLPFWNLTTPDQIEIIGARLLSAQELKQKINIDYPQYIYRMQTQAIASQLERKAPVYDVVVKRSLFPVKVTVVVQERQPVAKATFDGQAGFIDAKGIWISAKSYPTNIKKPEISVIGINSNVLNVWKKLYAQINRSPVKISKLDFRIPSNLILTTDLGLVYCGNYTYGKMEKQIQMLDRLRSLPKSSPSLNYTHIDLIDPNFPVVDGVTPNPAIEP
jgi:cell division protein FtsQ